MKNGEKYYGQIDTHNLPNGIGLKVSKDGKSLSEGMWKSDKVQAPYFEIWDNGDCELNL